MLTPESAKRCRHICCQAETAADGPFGYSWRPSQQPTRVELGGQSTPATRSEESVSSERDYSQTDSVRVQAAGKVDHCEQGLCATREPALDSAVSRITAGLEKGFLQHCDG